MDNKIKETLEKQLKLLSERSQLCSIEGLAPITEQMIRVARLLQELDRYKDLKDAGNCNSGNYNSGNWNTGVYNSGDWNSGNRNTGYCNSGNCNSGNCNSGYWNSGNRNSGNCNSGNCNSGDCNSGDCNSGNYNTGFFNTQTPKISLFNKPTNLSIEEIREIKGIQILHINYENNIWISTDQMTEEEKQEHPEYKTLKGYLKTIAYREAWRLTWDKLTEEEKKEVTEIPNFNDEIFQKITGIKIEK